MQDHNIYEDLQGRGGGGRERKGVHGLLNIKLSKYTQSYLNNLRTQEYLIIHYFQIMMIQEAIEI